MSIWISDINIGLVLYDFLINNFLQEETITYEEATTHKENITQKETLVEC